MSETESHFLEVPDNNFEAMESLTPEQKEFVRQIDVKTSSGMNQLEVPEDHYLSVYAEQMKELVFGHDEDIDSIMRAISGQAFRDESEPFSIFITGPEGSGKTETTQALADVLSDGKCTRIDCSKFKGIIPPSVAIVSDFVDSEGSILSLDSEDGSPTIIVFENIEKANESFFEYLTSGPMNEGKFTLTGQNGVAVVGVKNSVFLFTSRLGSDSGHSKVGYRSVESNEQKGRKLKEDIKKSAENEMKFFGERFIENIDHKVYYEALSDEDLAGVLDVYVRNHEAYGRYGISVELSNEVRNELIRSIPQDKRNATTVVRQYQRLVEPDISRLAAGGNIPDNHVVLVGKTEEGGYAYESQLDPNKIIEELKALKENLYPMMERYEELVEKLESQGIGLDSDGNPVYYN